MKKYFSLSKLLLIILLLPILLKAQFSGQVTVGYGGDFSTLKDFADSLNLGGLSGNTEVNIINDIQEFSPVVINQWAEIGDGGYYLSIKPFGESRTIQGNFSGDGVIVLNGADRVIIDGELNNNERNLNIINTSTTGANCAIRFIGTSANQGCTNVSIKNCIISGGNNQNPDSYGIFLGGSTIALEGSGFDHDDITIENNQIKKSQYGIFATANSAAVAFNFLKILKNEIGDSEEDGYICRFGISLNNCPSAIIKKNHIYNIKSSMQGPVTLFYIRNNIWYPMPYTIAAGIQLYDGNKNSIISDNIIHSIWQTYNNGLTTATGININTNNYNDSIQIFNNAIFDIITTISNIIYAGKYSFNPTGISIHGGNYLKIIHNSINLYGSLLPSYDLNDLYGTKAACILNTVGALSGFEVIDNVFSNTIISSDSIINYCFYSQANISSLKNMDYNAFYCEGTYSNVGYLGGTAYNTIFDWINGTQKDNNSFFANPEYISESNLEPSNTSPLIGAGNNLEDIPFDILGNPRIVPTTVGAYEFNYGINKPPVILISPIKNSISVPVMPEFSWTSLVNVNNYYIEIAQDINFTNIVYEQEVQGNSTVISSSLEELTLYYWRVRASVPDVTCYWSKVWNFYTDGVIPSVTLLNPLNNEIGLIKKPIFHWNYIQGVFNYELQISIDNNFNNIIFEKNLISGNSFNFVANSLNYSSLYYWRVRGYNSNNIGEWSEIRSFTTHQLVNTNTFSFTEENEEYDEFIDGINTEIYGSNMCASFELPFIFNYAGMNFDSVTISSNGYIKLGSSLLNITENDLSSQFNHFFIAALWDELFIPSSGNISFKTTGETPNRVFIIQYRNIKNLFDNEGNVNFQIKIFESLNQISFNYGTMLTENEWSASIGLTGKIGGNMDYISITPGTENNSSTASSISANNYIDLNQVTSLIDKKFVFAPMKKVDLISPANNSNSINFLPLFSWNELDGNNLYTIQVASDYNFTNIIFEHNEINELFYQTKETEILNLNTKYFWRIIGTRNNENSSLWSDIWCFTTQQVPWQISETNNSSNITVPTSINPMLGNRPFAEGDAIGLFYQNDNYEWACAGYGIWDGGNLSITVWGDNPDTEIKNGFSIGETYTFKVWDAVLGQEWNARATYQAGESFYTIGGFSMLASLIVYIPTEQNISLSSGWNIISSYVNPIESLIPTVFSNIVTEVKIVKNGAGQIYDPAFNINNIGNWNNEDGFLVNMLSDNELTISGQKLVPEETPININNGWNLSAYLRDNEMSPTAALTSISSSLVLVKDNVGGIFMPAFGINTIGNMQAGQGYYFYMNAASILTYPANSAQKAVAGDNITPLAKYNIPTMKNTGKNTTLLILIESNDGNEIGVYNMNNELIGSGAVHNGIAAITIWGDDEATQNVDGAKDNEYLNVKLYNATNNTSEEISFTQIKEITENTEQNELNYRTNAIYLAKASANDETGFAISIKNIPNPVESNVVFEFNLTDEANAEIQIYTCTGELVASIGKENYSAGLHRINFDASNLTSGMYNIVLSSGERRVTSFMIVNK